MAMSGSAGMAPHRAASPAAQRAAHDRSGGKALKHAPPAPAPRAAAPSVPRRRAATVAPAAAQSVRVADMSAQMAAMRAQMEENEQLSVLMAGLRGSNMNDEDFAEQDVVMQLISVTDTDGEVRRMASIIKTTAASIVFFKHCSLLGVN